MAWRGEAHLALLGRTHAGGARTACSRRCRSTAGRTSTSGSATNARCRQTHADSNYRMARETLLSAVPIPERAGPSLGGGVGARRCRGALRRGAARPGTPAGAGGAGLRPAAARHGCRRAYGVAVSRQPSARWSGRRRGSPPRRLRPPCDVPAMNTWRLTVTPATIRAARTVFVLVVGADKHAALRRVLGDSRRSWLEAPATLLHDVPGDVAWYVDRAALFGTARVAAVESATPECRRRTGPRTVGALRHASRVVATGRREALSRSR